MTCPVFLGELSKVHRYVRLLKMHVCLRSAHAVGVHRGHDEWADPGARAFVEAQETLVAHHSLVGGLRARHGFH